ncbi:MAG: GNAT family N-acetyltransferase [Bryobacteraceae bacterium]
MTSVVPTPPADQRASQRAAITESLRRAMSAYARSTERGLIEERPGMTLVSSGIDYPVFNAAIITGAGDAIDFSAKLARAAEFYVRRRVGWSCWYCEESAGGTRAEIARVLKRAGLRRVAEHQAMAAESLLPTRRRLPAIESRPVSTASTRLDFVFICTRVFGLPGTVAAQVYGSEPFWQGSFRAWVGYREGRPVCAAASESAPEGVGVYSVATIPELRGQGYGEAITRLAIERGAPAAGTGRAMLQATRAGARLYLRMGFEASGKIAVYATR